MPPYGVPLVVSARTADALRDTARQWADALTSQHGAQSGQDSSDTLQTPDAYDIAGHSVFRRQWHNEQAVVYGRSTEELVAALNSLADGKPLKQIATGKALNKDQPGHPTVCAETVSGIGPVFAYSGNGSQWHGMGRKLLADPVFVAAIEQVDTHFEPLAGITIRSLIDSEDESIYAATEYAQPALFAIQVGITTMLREAGVRPTAVIGHSVGEVAAAWACGALSLSDAVSVIYHRSYWQGQTRGRGFMSAVSLQAEATQQWLDKLGLTESVWVAGANSSRGSTIAGTLQGLEQFEAAMAQESVSVKRLDLDYAFHSPMMDEVESGVRTHLASITPHQSAIPFYSVVHGGLLEGTALNAEYWWLNIRRPVQFEQATAALVETGQRVFVEVGPHAILRGYITDALNAAEATGKVIATGRRGVESPEHILAAAGQVVINGGQIDWPTLFAVQPRWVDLPAYAWQRESLWYEGTAQSMDLLNRVRLHPLLGFAVPQQQWMWESTLDTDMLPSFADHKVGESVVFPGTGFVEIALAASTQWQPGAVARVHDLEILSPLLLDAGVSRQLRVTLDPADGHLTIHARTIGADEPWRLHARARVLPEPSLVGSQASAPALPARQADFTGNEHTLFTLGAGLQYGPAYCAIDKGWQSAQDGRDIAALLTVPDSISAEIGDYLLHPSLLDNSYQLIIHYLRDFVALDAGVTYVPTQMGEIIWYQQEDNVAHQVQVRILTRNPNSITAEFALFNRSGQIVANVREARFSAMHLKRQSSSALQYLKFQNIPAPRASTLTIPGPLGLHEWFACMQNTAQTIQQSPFEERFATETDPLLDVLVARYFADYLIKHGGNDPRALDDKIHALELAAHAAGSSQRRLLEVLLDLAQQNDLLSRRDDGWQLNEEAFSEVSASDIWLTLLRDSGHAFPLVHAAGRLGMHLENLLDLHRPGDKQEHNWKAEQSAQGNTSYSSTTEIELSGTQGPEQEEPTPGNNAGSSDWSWSTMLPVLVGPHGMHALEQSIHQRLQYALSELEPGQKVFVTEISAGEPWFGSACTQGLNADLILYTAQSVPTLDEQLSADPEEVCLQMAIVVLDADTPDEGQRMLRWACSRLLPDGVLMVVGANTSDWVQALLAAESPAQGTQGIPGSAGVGACQFGAQTWAHEVETLCGKPVKRLALWPTDEGTGVSGPYLLFAQKQATEKQTTGESNQSREPVQATQTTQATQAVQTRLPEHCLILTDQHTDHPKDPGLALLAELKATFVHSLELSLDAKAVSCAGTQDEIEQLLAAFCEQVNTTPDGDETRRPAHIIDLRGLLGVTDESDSPGILANQAQRCADIAHAAKTLQSVQFTGQYWVPAMQNLADAAVSGFMRTLMNEVSGTTARLVTFEFAATCDAQTVTRQAQAWAQEVRDPDAEQEIVFSRAGMRSVPRLRALPAPPAKACKPGEHHTGQSQSTAEFSPDLLQSRQIRLGFDMPGQLRNLRWEAVDRPALQDHEVEIAVKATGLNFRDVMYTLGLLSDEAVENGFAGASIGLEFAGVVSRVGDEVTDYKSGDEVVGFGPHGFTNFAITTSSALALLPQGMSFESAATVPSTFFTAYYALIHQARLQPGESVLIHGAAGGVGLAAIQIALWQGAKVYATAGSAAKQDLLRLLGIEHIYSSRHLDFADEILRDTNGQGVDVVLNSLSGEAINRNLQVLKPFGRFLELGKRDFYENSRIGLRPFRNNVSYFGIDADQLMKVRPDLTSQLFRQVMNLFEEGVLYPLPYEAHEAAHALDAFRQMQQARHIGKIVVTYNDGVPVPVKVSTRSAGATGSGAGTASSSGSDSSSDARQDGLRHDGVQLDANASYLVTGGLSGFGLRTAQWLTEKGARHLVLLGRRGAVTEQAQEAVAEFQHKGVTVIAPPCDITLADDVKRVLQHEMKDMPPLKGIVHAAAVFEDSLIMNLDHDKIQAVMAPRSWVH
nr:SDR family NAD(P)-dependent oxidoreductase [Orrella marina]